jgi:hypothetical protein
MIANEPTLAVSTENYDTLTRLSEEACRRSLPLLAQLPFDEGDAALRAHIES